LAIFGPINSERKLRRFGVLDLEWVPGEVLPMPERAELQIEGITEPLIVNLPPKKRRTRPLELRLAGYYDQQPLDEEDEGTSVMQERYEVFKSVEELIEFMLVRQHRGMWFYAHAGGLSDMEFVLDELLQQIRESLALERKSHAVYDPQGKKTYEEFSGKDKKKATWSIKATFSGSSAILIHVSKGKNSWHFVDSYWLFRDKLSKIGESIGIKKVDEDKRRTPEETRKYYAETPLSELIPYNKVDCEILWKAVAEFEKEVVSLGGQLQKTIASTAMNLFRRAFMKETIYTSEIANRVAQKAYFASRVEVHDRNVFDFLIYDINSSFPYSMTFPLPGNLMGMGTELPDYDSDSCLYVADVTVEVPDMDVPPLPFRTPNDSRVFFPTGRWRSWLTSTDIRLALREGCKIHAVHECYQYEPWTDLSLYATEIYALRSASKTPFRKLLLKYLLNSLYGKMGESLLKQEMLINPSEEELDRTALQMLQPGVWLRENEVSISHRHVIVSAIITALSRRHLYDYIKISHAQSCPVAYMDTDSLATRAILPTDDKQLGALKLEKKMAWAEFSAPKIYRGEGEELKDGIWKAVKLAKAKGFSLGKFSDPVETLGRVIEGEQIGVQTMVRMRELYRSIKDDGGESSTAPYEQLVIKALTQRMLSKRYQYPDGKTRAWSVEEILSGDFQARGFDFSQEFLQTLDTTTRAMLAAAV
jgi:hypothetical protein